MKEEFSKSYFADLVDFVKGEYARTQVFPPGKNIFRAFDKCPFDRVKVVVIGQDPYHGPGQANGLCFSVNDGVPFPPSLQNIFQEVNTDTGTPVPQSGNLDRWAEQGVLLLNAVLTVRQHEAASHAGMGWERFTDAVVNALATRREGLVYLLWGSYAQRRPRSWTPGATAYSRRYTRRHSRHTAGSSAAATSRRPTDTSSHGGSSR